MHSVRFTSTKSCGTLARKTEVMPDERRRASAVFCCLSVSMRCSVCALEDDRAVVAAVLDHELEPAGAARRRGPAAGRGR